jgi:hypothetical protein
MQGPSRRMVSLSMILWGVYFLVQVLFEKLVVALGADIAGVELFKFENTVYFQIITIFVSLWLMTWRTLPSKKFARIRQDLLPSPAYLNESLQGFFQSALVRGVLLGSLVVGMSLFLGIFRAEIPQTWGVNSLTVFSVVLFQAMSLWLWIVLIDRLARLLLSWAQITDGFEGRLFATGILAWVFFEVFCGSLRWEDRLIGGFVSSSAASAYLLWIEASVRLHRTFSRATHVRTMGLMGFFFALVHLYGFPMGPLHGVSLGSLVEGPESFVWGSSISTGISGSPVVLAMLILVVNSLLLRVLNRSPNLISGLRH